MEPRSPGAQEPRSPGAQEPISASAQAETESLRWLLACLLLLIAVSLVALVSRDACRSAPNLASRFFDERLDPKLDQPLMIAETGLHGRSLKPSEKGSTLLVAAGSCGSCSSSKFDPFAKKWHAFEKVIVVYNGEISQEDRAKLANLPKNVAVLEDRDGRITVKLNALWSPRFFLLDRAGNLIAKQRSNDELPAFLEVQE
ncbi:MAG: hypothetical protein AKCLJLPJ_01630 [Fimbriimonadales bacterium]|nr:hypothetical protein [Fimbriimonadales bacterium]